MIYLDNAATTKHKPLCVKLAMLKGITTYSANPGRSGHTLSINAALKVYDTRELIKSFFCAPKNTHVIFTGSCTESLSLSLIGTKQDNKHIVCTFFEHNSVIRTLEYLKQTYNIDYTLVKPNNFGEITDKEIEKALTKDTYLIVTNHTSNVTGKTINLYNIGKLAKRLNILFLVDAAQSAGHETIDMVKQNISMLCLAGHKGLLGPQGVGVLVTTVSNIKPIKFGGTGTDSKNIVQPTDLPEALEAGTLPTPNIVALHNGIKYVKKHFNNINNKIFNLSDYLVSNLKNVAHIELYSLPNKSGVISFKHKKLDTNLVTCHLNDHYNIAVRGGLHCAPLAHSYLKTEDTGLIRVSIGHKNTKCHIKKLIKALKNINKIYL